jgi:hypothetical protein
VPLHRADLDLAVRDGILSREQAELLWARAAGEVPAPDLVFGARPTAERAALAAVAAGAAAAAAAWLALVAWEQAGPAGGFAFAAAATVAAGAAARTLERRSLRVAAALLALAAVALAPLAVHALGRWLGHADPGGPPGTLLAVGRSGYLPSAIAAVVAAALGLRLFSTPAMAAALCASVWFALMLAAPLAFGPSPSWDQRALLSALGGVVAMGTGVSLDGRTRYDHSFWLYLAGLAAFCGGVGTMEAESGLSQLLLGSVNAALVLVALALRRRAFALFGAVGVAGVLGHAADGALEPVAVPFAIAAIAAAAAAGAIAYRRMAPAWEEALAARFPEPLRRLLPPRRAPEPAR